MRHPYLAKLWFLLLFLGAGSLFSGAVYAQATGSVSGRITDDKIQPSEAALEFVNSSPEVWAKWVPAAVASKVRASLK